MKTTLNAKVEYIQRGDYFICSIGGSLMTCVSCGAPLEFSAPHSGNRHKCSSSHESHKQSANTRLTEPMERDRPYWQRLSTGFDLMKEDGDDLDWWEKRSD